LIICGCQTVKKGTPLNIQASKEVISIHPYKESNAYGVEVRLIAYRLDQNGAVIAESQDILSASRVTGKSGKWLDSNVGVKQGGVDSTVSYLIDGEMINTPAFAGVNLISKIIPLGENKVHVKGIFVSSMFGENRKLTSMSLPINVICTLDEEKVLYEKEIKSAPEH
ncbi:MAG: hypothetical protein MUC65_03970, partial [Pontiellaceae bacterium]|nr:hypothetical protein [Pontiellaceae bacterium]